jgi:hypothetical protein
MGISKEFSAVGVSQSISVADRNTVAYSVTGGSTFDADLVLQRSKDLQAWETVESIDADASGSFVAEHGGGAAYSYRFACGRFDETSDPITVTIAESVSSLADAVSIKTVAGMAYTLSAADHGRVLWFTSGSAVTVTCPQDSTDPVPVGFSCAIVQAGAGTVTTEIEGTDTLVSKGDLVALDGTGAAGTILKQASGSWFLSGALA